MTKKERTELERLKALEKKEIEDAKLKLQALMKKEDDCPHCGKCKHCGRSDRPVYVPQPYYPWPRPYWYVDYANPPYVTYTDDGTTWKGQFTTSGTSLTDSSTSLYLSSGREQ